ncbi:MAG: RluA family pseudouridine synthase [Candidatus Dormibacteria bacterium]
MVETPASSEQELFATPADDGLRLDAVLAKRLGVSRGEAHQLIVDGRVAVSSGAAARPSLTVREGVAITVAAAPSEEAEEEVVEEPRVVYQDELMAVVDKPAGLVVHPAPGHRGKTLADVVRGWVGPWSAVAGDDRPGIVHRLDRGTSGLMVLARTDAAHLHLSQQLRARTMGREYWALARGHFREDRGRIDAAVGRDPAQPRRMAVTGDGREAATEFFVLERLSEHTSLRLRLLSGRTHQIRVHLAYIGRPLVGDGLYGPGGDRGRPALHAAMLHLRHPGTEREMVFCSPLPLDLQALRRSLGGNGEEAAAYPWTMIPGAIG